MLEILGLTPCPVVLACREYKEQPWRLGEGFQNIAAFSLLFGIWGRSLFYTMRTEIMRMCYKIITNTAALTSLGLQELLSLVQWLPVNLRITLIISGVLCRSEVSFGCLMIPLVQNCRSCLCCMAFFFFFSLLKDSSFFPLKWYFHVQNIFGVTAQSFGSLLSRVEGKPGSCL